MFGDSAGYVATDPNQTSEKYNAMVDKEVKNILDVKCKRFNFYRNHLKELVNFYNRKRRSSENCQRTYSTMTT